MRIRGKGAQALAIALGAALALGLGATDAMAQFDSTEDLGIRDQIRYPDLADVNYGGSVDTLIGARARDPEALNNLQKHNDDAGWGTPYDVRTTFTARGELRYKGRNSPINLNRAGIWFAWFEQGAIMLKVEKRGTDYVAFAVVQSGRITRDYPPITLRPNVENRLTVPGGFVIVLTPTLTPKTLEVAIHDEVSFRAAAAAKANARGRNVAECGEACLPPEWNTAQVTARVRAELTPQFQQR